MKSHKLSRSTKNACGCCRLCHGFHTDVGCCEKTVLRTRFSRTCWDRQSQFSDIHRNLHGQVRHRKILTIFRLGFKPSFFYSLIFLILCLFIFLPHYFRLHVSACNCRLLRRYFRDLTHKHATGTEITLFRMHCARRHSGPWIVREVRSLAPICPLYIVVVAL